MTKVEWFAVDWGTTNLRVWGVDKAGDICVQLTSSKGMGAITPESFEPVLLELIAPYLEADRRIAVIACGMVGSRQGWHEAPYRQVPCDPVETTVTVPVMDARIHVEIVPGLSQQEPADVMRGEETQIYGLISSLSKQSASICLPGTHTKWVSVVDHKVVGFNSVMTGELFHLLSTQSVLRFSVESEGFDELSFIAGLEQSKSSEYYLINELFSLRAQSLLSDVSNTSLKSKLSGMLIGSEVASIKRNLDPSSEIIIVGTDHLALLYSKALSHFGFKNLQVSGETAALDGLRELKSKFDNLSKRVSA